MLKIIAMLLLIAVLAILVLAVGLFAILGLAKMDTFFTLVEEGTAKAIMSLDGFHRMIFQYQGRKIDENGNIAENDQNIEKLDKKNKLSFFKKQFGGLRWLGIPGIHSVHEYHFRWATLRPQSGEIIKREPVIGYIMLKDDVYVAEVKNAESKGMVPLNILLLVTARCVNPYKALFRAQDWMEMVINRSEAIFRQYVAGYEFEVLIGKRQAAGKEIMGELEATGLIKEFEDEYGIKVIAIEMRNVDPTGESKKQFEDAAAKKWLATKEADSILELAAADKKRVETVYKAILSFGDSGMALRYLESIDKAGQKQGNWIIPFDIKSIQNLLGKNFQPQNKDEKGENP